MYFSNNLKKMKKKTLDIFSFSEKLKIGCIKIKLNKIKKIPRQLKFFKDIKLLMKIS